MNGGSEDWIVPGKNRALVMPRGADRRVKLTKTRREAFLEHLAATCNVTASAAAAGVSFSALYRCRMRDADFREAWRDAIEQGYARLEAALLERAMRGEGRIAVDGDLEVDGPDAPHEIDWDKGRAAMARMYGGTRLGRQELDGHLFEDVAGALWTRALIEGCRVTPPLPTIGRPALSPGQGQGAGQSPQGERAFRRVVVAVDPPAIVDGDACGIVACGLGRDGIGYVLGDHSAGGLSPGGWAAKVAAAAGTWGADRVVAEANNGGNMVEAVLRSASAALPVSLVRASEGKSARAEPVAMLFESGSAKLAGNFPELEDQLCGLTIGGGYAGPGRSPDRADAMVWGLSELMLGARAADPGIRTF